MITYGITVSDEEFEFKRLINSLQPYLFKDEEIVVLADANKVTDNIISHAKLCNLKVNYFNFQKNFSDYKNQLFDLSSKDFLFQIDADEQVPPSLLYLLRSVAKTKEADLVWIPRINIVHGATEQDIKNFKWKINELGWEGFPDYQARFVDLKSQIRWTGDVHETLKGANNPKVVQQAPAELYSLLHVKSIEKQRRQNSFYDTI
jgi:glycosyltransferase involved in cell wall biosynthesis